MSSLKRVWQVLREQGPLALFARVVRGIARSIKPMPNSVPIRLLVKTEDASEVDWSIPHPAVVEPRVVTGDKLTVAWIMSPPGESSGGHQNIFRFMSYLEAAGHTVKIYLYSSLHPFTVAIVKDMLASSPSYPKLKASIEAHTGQSVGDDVDAIFATGWETAYASFRDEANARRFYFVQDFEPYFTPVGSASVLAENTYRFGFHGITAGGFLSHKLSTEYGMAASHYDFGADKSLYNVTNQGRRKEIFFYARPVTERRGFELGILALAHFARERPDYVINLAGWDVSTYKIPFPYVNLQDLRIDELNDVYNRCAAGLVISLTNMSLLPLELLASGVIPVVNDGENNRLVSDNPFIEYADPSPKALARRLIEVVDRADLPEHARLASESVQGADWDAAGATFVKLFEDAVRG
ncbi:glycosyltransferase family 1 protein [Agreia sp. PsM10]|uniref:rhamnosyltransferase WsaF family glycosyltransferase n=1 Tax=Agreia sp. PsM10 TaxID=3030533 RepID=UPI00263B0320|nr:glycosyltransferase family 1 protein [Agreia sp. PsM10]MDN4639290.1 glycosyltransferase family 1 protein [Agreia sp. PsM10]